MSGVVRRLPFVASLALACAVVAGCDSGSGATGADGKPAALVLTAKEVGAARTDDTGPADLLDESPAALAAALPLSSGHPTWRAFTADYQSVGVGSLAATLRTDADSKRLLGVAPLLARFEGVGGGRVVRSVPIGDAAVLVRGRVITPVGQLRTGAAVVFRENAVVGVVVAQTAAAALRFARIQAARAG